MNSMIKLSGPLCGKRSLSSILSLSTKARPISKPPTPPPSTLHLLLHLPPPLHSHLHQDPDYQIDIYGIRLIVPRSFCNYVCMYVCQVMCVRKAYAPLTTSILLDPTIIKRPMFFVSALCVAKQCIDTVQAHLYNCTGHTYAQATWVKFLKGKKSKITTNY